MPERRAPGGRSSGRAAERSTELANQVGMSTWRGGASLGERSGGVDAGLRQRFAVGIADRTGDDRIGRQLDRQTLDLSARRERDGAAAAFHASRAVPRLHITIALGFQAIDTGVEIDERELAL